MDLEQLAKDCGATFYRHRTSPHQAAVAFGPAAWERFIKATVNHFCPSKSFDEHEDITFHKLENKS